MLFDILFNISAFCALVLVIVLVIIVVLAWFLRPLQHALVYHPDEPTGSRSRLDGPKEFGVSRYEILEIDTPDQFTLRGFAVYPSMGTAKFTLVYFHGNAGNAGHRTPIARMLAERLQCNVIMMDYRCYGLSDSKGTAPDDVGLQTDGKAILDYSIHREDWSRVPIFVMGTSLGGAVAIHLASQAEYELSIRGWIVENTFTSLSAMADALFVPLIKRRFPGWRGDLLIFTLSKIIKPLTIHTGWYSIKSITKATGAMLFISSAKDELVPPSHVRSLFDAATRCSTKRFVNLPDSSHNDAPAAPNYCDHLQEFINEVIQRGGPSAAGTGRVLGSV